MLFFRHPSKRALRDWLAGNDDSLDEHLDSCQRCAAELEEIELEGVDDAESPELSQALAAVFSPPEDLSNRLERRVVARLDSRVVLDVVSDIFAAGFETSRLLLTEELAEDL